MNELALDLDLALPFFNNQVNRVHSQCLKLPNVESKSRFQKGFNNVPKPRVAIIYLK